MPNYDYNLENVLTLGVLTGSRAFNCSTTESDWDIAIIESNVPHYKNSTYYRETIFNWITLQVTFQEDLVNLFLI